MSKFSEQIVECFMLNWDLFGDDESTEFLVQYTADQLHIQTDAVYAALKWKAERDATPASLQDRGQP